MKNIFTYGIFAIFICSCMPTSGSKGLNVIILDHFASKPEKVSLNEIANRIDYIQLETTPESLIGRIGKIQIKDNKMYILDELTESILVFNISGQFIRRIGTKGRGPGEYISIRDFALCDSVILVRDAGQSKVILYDTLGRLMADKMFTHTISNVAFYNGMPIWSRNYPDFAFHKGFRISIFDRNLNSVADILKSKIDLDEASARQYGMSHFRSFFELVNDTLTFWECREDVIYKIIDQNRIEEKYMISYKNPSKYEDGMDRRNPGYNEISSMKEARNYIFMVGGYDGKYCRLIYFKETNKGICVEGKLINSNGPDFFPHYLANDKQAFESFSIYAYKTELEKNNITQAKLDSKLQLLLNTCAFDDNPCVMLVTLK